MSIDTQTVTCKELDVDFAVVGGGMAGVCAAVAAARNGCKVALIQDRPVLGGNGSSEIRVAISGAYGDVLPDKTVLENRETGLIEEVMLRNLFCNPTTNWSNWDFVLYRFVRDEPNLTLLLNCSVNRVETENARIRSVTAWHLGEYCEYRVRAALFADCSGDSILRLSGAKFTRGREGRAEFGESYAPEVGDDKTMGSSLREVAMPCMSEFHPYRSPGGGFHFTSDTLPNREPHQMVTTGRAYGDPANFEWGGELDTLKDSDQIRDEILRYMEGAWAYSKNQTGDAGRPWEITWRNMLPGKRESYRYLGDHILTQNDLLAHGDFPDAIGHGGWPMDDHFPEGFRSPRQTVFHPCPTVYGIPFRSLYSLNVENLLFAGRNISQTHMALSSTRVQATCAVMGQAVGTAAALGIKYGCTPREVAKNHLAELQDLLQEQDQFIPNRPRRISALTAEAKVSHEALRDGTDRPRLDGDHGAWFEPGESCVCEFTGPRTVAGVRLVVDSDFSDNRFLRQWYFFDRYHAMPAMMPRNFRVELRRGGKWETAAALRDNWRRLVNVSFAPVAADAVRVVWENAHGGGRMHVFSFEVK